MNKELIDHVWKHCLPKEFKEEVKKEYEHQISIDNEQAYWMLERMFGKHNLTSDAEGEEMLTVSRKKVQEFYAKCKEVTKNPYSYPDYSHESALSRMALLDILFGSKCLPDVPSSEPKFKYKEGDKVVRYCDRKVYVVVDYCKDDNINHYIIVDALGNRYSDSEGNLKLYEGPKYHVGQKVRYKGQNHEIGEIAKYWSDEDPGRYSVRFGKEYHNISEDMLDLYEGPKPAEPITQFKFKVGDKVRYKEVYTIEEIEKDGIALVDSDFLVDPEDLELYEEAKEDKAGENSRESYEACKGTL